MSMPLALWNDVPRKCLVECSSKHVDMVKSVVVDRPEAEVVRPPKSDGASMTPSFDVSQLHGLVPHHWASHRDDRRGWVLGGVGGGEIREDPRFRGSKFGSKIRMLERVLRTMGSGSMHTAY